MESDDIDPTKLPPLLFETMLGEVEGMPYRRSTPWSRQDSPVSKRPDLGLWLAAFLAFQVTRGHTFREEHRAITNALMLEHYRDVTDQGLATVLSGSGREPTEDAVAAMRAFLEDWKVGAARVSPRLRRSAAAWSALFRVLRDDSRSPSLSQILS